MNSKIIMPEYVPISKVEATECYSGDAMFYGNGHDKVRTRAHEIEKSEGWTYVRAFNDGYVMTG